MQISLGLRFFYRYTEIRIFLYSFCLILCMDIPLFGQSSPIDSLLRLPVGIERIKIDSQYIVVVNNIIINDSNRLKFFETNPHVISKIKLLKPNKACKKYNISGCERGIILIYTKSKYLIEF